MGHYYGTAISQPTGFGLPDFEYLKFGTAPPQPPLRDVIWCEKAGVPKSECVHCKEQR